MVFAPVCHVESCGWADIAHLSTIDKLNTGESMFAKNQAIGADAWHVFHHCCGFSTKAATVAQAVHSGGRITFTSGQTATSIEPRISCIITKVVIA